MSNFDGIVNPDAAWADVPLLSTAALALGGAGGPMNAQAFALAARTRYLQAAIAALAATYNTALLAFWETGLSI